MRDRPTVAELLAIARQVVRESLLDALPGDKRYHGLMVANAIAIAARQLDYGLAPEREEMHALAALLEEDTEADTPEGVHARLLIFYRRLVADIRAGRLDPGTPKAAAARAHLWRVTLQRVRESNPKALPKEES
jgi:hypothetical protein